MKALTLPCLPWSIATPPSSAGWLTARAATTSQPVIYRAGIDALDAEPLGGWLTGQELARAGRFHNANDRRRFAVGRGVLRQLLGSTLGRAPLALEFMLGLHGKPYLAEHSVPSAHAGPFFNVSHSGDWVLIALHGSREVGVDVEQIQSSDDWEAVAAQVFSARVLAALRVMAPAEREDAFFAAWTRHEARLKAHGGGFAVDDGRGASGADEVGSPVEADAYNVVTLAVPSGYAASCAWRRP